MADAGSAGRRVRVGLTTYRESAAWGVWNEPADLLPVSYADAVHKAGGVPLLLPPVGGTLVDMRTEDIVDMHDDLLVQATLDAIDGLMLTGGADVEPARYGAARHPATGPSRPDRDAWEIALTRAAIDRKMPVLGVCRGMQVLAVALGGTLLQHLPDVVGTDQHCPTVGRHARHDVRISPDSRLSATLGAKACVATYHHQAIERLPDSLRASGWAQDGTVEACEAVGDDWTVGVQWHPEVYDETGVIESFLSACRRRQTALGIR